MNDDIALKNKFIAEKNQTIEALRNKLRPESSESILKQRSDRL